MQETHDLELLLRSGTALLIIETQEEPRALKLLTQIAIRLNQDLSSWSITDGLAQAQFGGAQAIDDTTSPEELLKHLKTQARPGCYALLDFHPFLDDSYIVRAIKDIAQTHHQHRQTLIFISHSFTAPGEIAHLTRRFELSLPNQATIEQILKHKAWEYKTHNPDRAIKIDQRAVRQLVRNLRGVTYSDAERLIHNAIEHDGAITHSDVETVMAAKQQLLGKDGIISFEYNTESFANVAGLNQLKHWLDQRRRAFLSTDTEHDDRPRGLLMVGVQGAGKSLAAKACAGLFKVPLLRLDFATLYNKYVGETERNLRNALQTAEAMAPCVLWIDEIEKGLSEGGDSDNGIARRTLGTLLTWLSENQAPVFITATANDISRLPPELIRKGRLDEIFFVDLPDPKTRAHIFQIHLNKRKQQLQEQDIQDLAEAAHGFSGAEIEQAVVSAIYHCHASGQPLSAQTLLNEIDRTRPLSVTMAEKIAQLRAWAAERTVPAH